MAPSLAPQPAGKPCSAPAAPWSWLLIDSEDGFPDSYVTLQAIEDGEEATQKKTLKKKKKTHIYIYKDSVTGPSFPSLCKCGITNKRPSGHFQLHPSLPTTSATRASLLKKAGTRQCLESLLVAAFQPFAVFSQSKNRFTLQLRQLQNVL